MHEVVQRVDLHLSGRRRGRAPVVEQARRLEDPQHLVLVHDDGILGLCLLVRELLALANGFNLVASWPGFGHSLHCGLVAFESQSQVSLRGNDEAEDSCEKVVDDVGEPEVEVAVHDDLEKLLEDHLDLLEGLRCAIYLVERAQVSPELLQACPMQARDDL